MTERLHEPHDDQRSVDIARELVPEFGDDDAGLLGQLISETARSGDEETIQWPLRYAITHPNDLSAALREAPSPRQASTRPDDTLLELNTSLLPGKNHEKMRIAPRRVLEMAQRIQTSGILARITGNQFVTSSAQLSPEARQAIESDPGYRIQRSAYYMASNDPHVYRLHQTNLLYAVAPHGATMHDDRRKKTA